MSGPCRCSTARRVSAELAALHWVGDVRAWHEVCARCGRCHRQGRVSLDAISRKAEPAERLLGVARWLRCAGCGNRVGNSIYLVMLPRD